MPRPQQMRVIAIVLGSLFLGFSFVSFFSSQSEGTRHPSYSPQRGSQDFSPADPALSIQDPLKLEDGVLHGTASAPKLENATLK